PRACGSKKATAYRWSLFRCHRARAEPGSASPSSRVAPPRRERPSGPRRSRLEPFSLSDLRERLLEDRIPGLEQRRHLKRHARPCLVRLAQGGLGIDIEASRPQVPNSHLGIAVRIFARVGLI